MSKNILFIGPTRSGTTFIWSVLLQNSKRHKTFTIHNNKEHYLFEKLYGTKGFYTEYDKIFNGKISNIDFSPTVFHLLSHREEIIIDDFFDKIVVIARDPFSLWKSSYHYSVSDGMAMRGTFDEIVETELCDGYSYDWILKTLQKNPELKKKLHVIQFDQITDHKELKTILIELTNCDVEIPKSSKSHQNSSKKIIPQNYTFNKLREWVPLEYRRNYAFKIIRRLILKLIPESNEVQDKNMERLLAKLICQERKIISEIIKITN